MEVLNDGWDLMIAHPECRYLCLSGARWFGDERYPSREQDWQRGVEFFMKLQDAPIDKIAIENSEPLGRTVQRVGRYDQVVQPYHFGQPTTKGCFLWLKNLPKLIHTHTVDDYEEIKPEVHMMAPGPERSKNRSKFPSVIADAMARQWGNGEIPGFKDGLFKEC